MRTAGHAPKLGHGFAIRTLRIVAVLPFRLTSGTTSSGRCITRAPIKRVRSVPHSADTAAMSLLTSRNIGIHTLALRT